ncbi:hypothetical protein OL548_31940 [Lysinibacillus sp. MHQ-1]|nr:hypothetical protein OL548_31940 [Lysinibacillus sp. MHQ-1]
MRQQLGLLGKSQYDASIAPNYRNSACGPTTVHVILNYLNGSAPSINELYKQLGSTKNWFIQMAIDSQITPIISIVGCSYLFIKKKLCRKLMQGVQLLCVLIVILVFVGEIKPLLSPIIGYR